MKDEIFLMQNFKIPIHFLLYVFEKYYLKATQIMIKNMLKCFLTKAQKNDDFGFLVW